jgi:predicted acyl esterase
MGTTQEGTAKQGQVAAATMLIEKDVAIPTRDGSILYCDVFRPNTDVLWPIWQGSLI